MKEQINMGDDSSTPDHTSGHAAKTTPFSCNEIRLSFIQWLLALAVIVVLSGLIPKLWEYIEKYEPGNDYRVPYALSDDYWLYGRYSRSCADKSKVMVIGDSVVWGHYVPPDGSLSHYLNETTGTQIFANLGIDGIHPVALAGLLDYYCKAITGRKVILSFNPLWMTSEKYDLQTNKEFRFNHPKLVPQFIPKIACYTESIPNRIGIIAERNIQFLTWASHIRTVYFNKMDLASWTMEHPLRCPFRAVTLELPKPEAMSEYDKPWDSRGAVKQDLPWVTLDSSVQWKSFKRAVGILQQRGNTVFVLIGPFNEHMMSDKSLSTYRSITAGIETWLQEKRVPYYLPAPLPSGLYADASHPLRKGYEMLARHLVDDESFQTVILNPIWQSK